MIRSTATKESSQVNSCKPNGWWWQAPSETLQASMTGYCLETTSRVWSTVLDSKVFVGPALRANSRT
jgi:hypothetical protein